MSIMAMEYGIAFTYGRPGGWGGSRPPLVDVILPWLGFFFFGYFYLTMRFERIAKARETSNDFSAIGLLPTFE